MASRKSVSTVAPVRLAGALFLALLVLCLAACGGAAEGPEPTVEPKCYIGAAEGTRVEFEGARWCCTITCFDLDEAQCPPGEQLIQFASSAPPDRTVIRGCNQANATGADWCCPP